LSATFSVAAVDAETATEIGIGAFRKVRLNVSDA
jgi:hypothetical protein